MRITSAALLLTGIVLAGFFTLLAGLEAFCLPVVGLLSPGWRPAAGALLPAVYWGLGLSVFIVLLFLGVGHRLAAGINEERLCRFLRFNPQLLYLIGLGFGVTVGAMILAWWGLLPDSLPVAMGCFCLGLGLAYQRSFRVQRHLGVVKFDNQTGSDDYSYVGNQLHSILISECSRYSHFRVLNELDEQYQLDQELKVPAETGSAVTAELVKQYVVALPAWWRLDYLVCGSFRLNEKKEVLIQVFVFDRQGRLLERHEEAAGKALLEKAYRQIARHLVGFLGRLPKQ